MQKAAFHEIKGRFAIYDTTHDDKIAIPSRGIHGASYHH